MQPPRASAATRSSGPQIAKKAGNTRRRCLHYRRLRYLVLRPTRRYWAWPAVAARGRVV